MIVIVKVCWRCFIQGGAAPCIPLDVSSDRSPFIPLDVSSDRSPFIPLDGSSDRTPFIPLDVSSDRAPFIPLDVSSDRALFIPLHFRTGGHSTTPTYRDVSTGHSGQSITNSNLIPNLIPNSIPNSVIAPLCFTMAHTPVLSCVLAPAPNEDLGASATPRAEFRIKNLN